MTRKCGFPTKRGHPCRRPAAPGAKHCFIHSPRPGDLPREDVVNEASHFMSTASDDLLTLAVMKAQYCDKQLPSKIKDRMQHLETVLNRILHGQPGPPKVPGLHALLQDASAGSQELTQMRRKFVSVFRELTQLIVEHCKVKGLAFKLPDLSVKLTVKNEQGLGGCRDVPAALRQWFQDRDDFVWKDKQVLCLAGFHGRHVNLPEGHILPGGFVVVRNVGEGAFYGVARRGQDSWTQRLLELLKRKCKESLVTLVEMLWAVLRSATDAALAVLTWKRLLVVVCTSILTKNTWALAAIPQVLLKLCVRVLQAIGFLTKQAVGYIRKGKPLSSSQAVAVWFAANIQAEVCPFVPKAQGLLPPPCLNCPRIGPPPPVPALPKISKPSWLAMIKGNLKTFAQEMLSKSAEEYVLMLVLGAAHIFASSFDVIGWLDGAGTAGILSCYQEIAETVSSSIAASA